MSPDTDSIAPARSVPPMKLATIWVAVLLLATVTPEHTSLWLKLFAIVPLVYAALGAIGNRWRA